ncbi:MAG: 1-acyl-sn-glycerol-3-phosphate acyltransferase [Holophagae bacterium]|nr:MAG: 1-acyl-sn-glycerol-3-phosphate acyltransferase [Holophagae bacterium]
MCERRPRPWWWWAYQPYKWLVVGPVLAISTLVFGGVAVALSPVLSPRRVGALCGAPWARLNARLTPMAVEVVGRSHIDRGRSYVVVSNHQSLYDILLVYGWLGVDFRWVMKAELRRVPGLGAACERLGHIFVDRSSPRAALVTLETARRRIAEGASVLFFPEGTRSLDGTLGAFKRGAFRMALDLGLPILPMTIIGTRKILPPGSRDLRPGRAKLVIHPPIETAGWSADRLPELIERAREAIARH